MKKIIIGIIFLLLFSCQDKTSNNNYEMKKINQNFTDIELVKKHLKLQEKIDLSEDDTNINNLYHLTEFDMELGGKFVYQGLVQNGYKIPKKEDFNQRIKEIFDNGNCLYSAKRNHDEFVTYFVYDKNFIKNLDEIEYDYTFDHIYVYPKLEIITLLPLLGDILTINKDKINIHLSEQIIHRNKYLFNDDKASFVWLYYNDQEFLKNLLIVFGYTKEEKINELVLKEFYEKYKTENDKESIWNLFFAKSCDGKLHIRKDLLRYIEEKNDKYLSVLSDYIISDLYKNPSYTTEEKAEIIANISNVEIRIREKNKESNEEANTWQPSISRFFYLQNKKAKHLLEILTIMKSHNYWELNYLKHYIQNNELQLEIPNSNLLSIRTIRLYSSPNSNSTYKELTINESELEYLHKVSDWDFVRVPHMVGYLAPENPKKHSFLAEEDFTPKEQKGFWDKLFG